jgi:hypothetical protein
MIQRPGANNSDLIESFEAGAFLYPAGFDCFCGGLR